MFHRMEDEGRRAVEAARAAAARLGHDAVDTGHLLLGVLATPGSEGARILDDLGVDTIALALEVERRMPPRDGEADRSGPLPFTRAVKRALEIALAEAELDGRELAGSGSVLLGILREREGLGGAVLRDHGVAPSAVRERLPTRSGGDAARPAPGGSAPEGTAPATAPGGIAEDLIALDRAGALDPVVGREEEVERCLRALRRRRARSVLLVGPSGVGKTAVAHGLVARAAAAGGRVLRLDFLALLAGTDDRGALEARVADLVRGLSLEGGAVLFVDDVERLLEGPYAEEGAAVFSLLRHGLASGALALVATIAPAALARLADRDPGLRACFQVVPVAAPGPAKAARMLAALAPRLEAHHGARYAPGIPERAAEIAAQRFPSRPLPASAVDLLDHAGTLAVDGVVDAAVLDRAVAELLDGALPEDAGAA